MCSERVSIPGCDVQAERPRPDAASQVDAYAQHFDLEVVRDAARFYALKDEWDALWSRANGHHHQAFSVCWLSWVHTAQARGRRLCCITLRKENRLVLVWPLVSYRQLLWTMLRPLTPDTAEHSTMLTEDDGLRVAAITQAWQAAMKQCRADAMVLPYVDGDTPLYRLAAAQPGLMVAVKGTTSTARLRGEKDWPTFCATLGNLGKKKPDARERRLAKEGQLVVRALGSGDAAEFPAWVDWLVARKREWVERGDKRAGWLETAGYRNYLLDLLNSADPYAQGRLFVITLNGAPAAASIIGLGTTCVNGLITGFDENLAKFGPGLIVVEHCVRWALEHEKDFDFGVGAERFKTYWSRDVATATWSFEIATTWWGRVAVPAKQGWYRIEPLIGRWRVSGLQRRISPAHAAVDEAADVKATQAARRSTNLSTE